MGRFLRHRDMNLNVDRNDVVDPLGVRTETVAVDRALDLLLFREELVAGVERIAGTGGVENFFDEPTEP